MSTLSGSVYRKTLSRSVYSESLHSERAAPMGAVDVPPPNVPPPRAPSSSASTARTRSPKPPSEVSAVDPTLDDVQKTGNSYHITMSLNAALAEAAASSSTGRAGHVQETILERAPSSRSVSRVDVYPSGGGDYPVPAPRLGQLGHGSAVRVIRVDGNDVPGMTAFPYPQDVTAMNDGFSIRSVQPSTSSTGRREIQTTTTVERIPGDNTVGFDLELIGGQTVTITETTTDAGTVNHPRIAAGGGGGAAHEGAPSWEAKQTRRRNGADDNAGKTKNKNNRKMEGEEDDGGKDSPDLGTMIDEADLDSAEFTRSVLPHRRPNAGAVGGGTKSGYDPRSSGRTGAGGGGGGGTWRNDDESVESQRQREVNSAQERRNPWLLQGGDEDSADPSWTIYRQLVKGAGPGTVRQRVTVEKDEDDIVEDGPRVKDMLNVDTVSEKVLVFVGNDIAEMTIKVRTERIVPIKGTNKMFRKSAVVVNRIIEVDMTATSERQRIYENVVFDGQQGTSGLPRDLTQKETFDLYKAFLRLAEEDATRDQVRIDKTTDEARLEELEMANNFSFIDASDAQQRPSGSEFADRHRSASRYRESQFHEYDNDDFSTAIY